MILVKTLLRVPSSHNRNGTGHVFEKRKNLPACNAYSRCLHGRDG